jgi:ribosomal protein S18 acetylase RimI-like enzyme
MAAESSNWPISRVRTSGQVREAAAIVAEAFFTLRSAEWLVPDPERRQAVLTDAFAITITHALDYGHVDQVTHPGGPMVAVAVWFHNEKPPPPPPNYGWRLRQVAGELTDRFQVRDALFDTHHPHEPHHYLALLAVRPAYQGALLGTALLRHHRAQPMPAYLEAVGLDSFRLYWNHGFRPHGDSFVLPNRARFYPMWRDPEV